jgi:hypothetical protein
MTKFGNLILLLAFMLALDACKPKQGESVAHVEAYTNSQFNSGKVQARLERLSGLLLEQGVCELPMIDKVANLGLRNQTDLMHHFLCLSNHESLLGGANDGIGGNGLIGINKMHLKKGGVCAGLTLDNVLHDPATNISCAFRLYRIKGFRDWGSTKGSWGTNRWCTEAKKRALHFPVNCRDDMTRTSQNPLLPNSPRQNRDDQNYQPYDDIYGEDDEAADYTNSEMPGRQGSKSIPVCNPGYTSVIFPDTGPGCEVRYCPEPGQKWIDEAGGCTFP